MPHTTPTEPVAAAKTSTHASLKFPDWKSKSLLELESAVNFLGLAPQSAKKEHLVEALNLHFAKVKALMEVKAVVPKPELKEVLVTDAKAFSYDDKPKHVKVVLTKAEDEALSRLQSLFLNANDEVLYGKARRLPHCYTEGVAGNAYWMGAKALFSGIKKIFT